MKKHGKGKLLSLLLGGSMALSAVLPGGMTAYAAEETETAEDPITTIAIGDITETGESDCTDLVLLGRYLLKDAPLEKQQFYNADLNLDGRVNGFDLALLKYQILQDTGVQYRTQNVDYFDYEALSGFSNPTSGVVTSFEELTAYLTAANADAEIQKTYLEQYDDAFFEEHVLLLSTDSVWYGYGASILSVSYSGDTLTIVYEKNILISAMGAELAPNDALFQVTLPKSLYHADTVTWTCADSQNAETKTETEIDFTPRMDAVPVPEEQESAVITSTQELETYLREIAAANTMGDAEKTETTLETYLQRFRLYDESFFAENVLLCKGIVQSCGELCAMHIDRVVTDGDTMTVRYYEYANYQTEDVVTYWLMQAVISRADYQGETVVWESANVASYLPGVTAYDTLESFSIGLNPSTAGNETAQALQNGMMITSVAELEAAFDASVWRNYSSSAPVEVPETFAEQYDDTFFSDHALLMRAIECAYGSDPFDSWLTSGCKIDDRIVVNSMWYGNGGGCEYTTYLAVFEIDAADAASAALEWNLVTWEREAKFTYTSDVTEGFSISDDLYDLYGLYTACYTNAETFQTALAELAAEESSALPDTDALLEQYDETFFTYYNLYLINCAVDDYTALTVDSVYILQPYGILSANLTTSDSAEETPPAYAVWICVPKDCGIDVDCWAEVEETA